MIQFAIEDKNFISSSVSKFTHNELRDLNHSEFI